MTTFLKFVHLAAIAIWSGGLIALPFLFWQRRALAARSGSRPAAPRHAACLCRDDFACRLRRDRQRNGADLPAGYLRGMVLAEDGAGGGHGRCCTSSPGLVLDAAIPARRPLQLRFPTCALTSAYRGGDYRDSLDRAGQAAHRFERVRRESVRARRTRRAGFVSSSAKPGCRRHDRTRACLRASRRSPPSPMRGPKARDRAAGSTAGSIRRRPQLAPAIATSVIAATACDQLASRSRMPRTSSSSAGADDARRDAGPERHAGRPQANARPERITRPPVEDVDAERRDHERDREMHHHHVERMARPARPPSRYRAAAAPARPRFAAGCCDRLLSPSSSPSRRDASVARTS